MEQPAKTRQATISWSCSLRCDYIQVLFACNIQPDDEPAGVGDDRIAPSGK